MSESVTVNDDGTATVIVTDETVTVVTDLTTGSAAVEAHEAEADPHPQYFQSGDTGSFTGVTVTGLTASSLVATDSNKTLTSSTSGLSPTFTGLTLSGLTSGRVPFATTAGQITDSVNLTYSDALLQVGSGSAASQGWAAGYNGNTGFSGLWNTGQTRTATNGVLISGSSFTYLQGPTVQIGNNGTAVLTAASSAITAAQPIRASDGTSGAPSISFSAATTTGFRRSGNNFIAQNSGENSWFFRDTGLFANSVRAFGWSSTADATATADLYMTRLAAKQMKISGDGTGASTNAGLTMGYSSASGYGGIWGSQVTPSTNNSALMVHTGGTETILNAGSGGTVYLSINNDSAANRVSVTNTGTTFAAGTATTDVNAARFTQTMNAAAVNFTGLKGTFTQGASGTGSSTKLLDLLYGTSGIETSQFTVSKSGVLAVGNGAVNTPSITARQSDNAGFYSPTTSQIACSSGNKDCWTAVGPNFKFSSDIIVGFCSAASNGGTMDSALSRVSAGVIGVGTGSAGSTAGTLRAAALAAGGSDFTITAVNSVSPTAPNRTVTISYNGTTYYLQAKTTND